MEGRRESAGYVWEALPTTLEDLLYHVNYYDTFLSPKMREANAVPVMAEGDAKLVTMMIHGCVNLCITFLPRADV